MIEQKPNKTSHALLSASGSAKWLACPGSIQMEKEQEDSPSDAALYGTQAHALAEHCLTNNLNTYDFTNQSLSLNDLSFIVDADMSEGVQLYLDYVRNLKGKLLVEVRVDYSPWVEGWIWYQRRYCYS